jgi:uncharacterized membrane protein YgcG
VSERPLLQFDSASTGASPSFRTANVHLPRDSAMFYYQPGFGPNVYYVALTLTGPAIVAGQPPAVAAIEIIGLEPPGGSGNGNGDGGDGGGSGGGGYDEGGNDDDPGHEQE